MDELSELFQSVSRYFALLSDPTRLRITHCICKQEKTVSQIIEALDGTQTNISRHLSLMWRADLVSRRKDGNFVFYSIRDPALLEICHIACARMVDQMVKTQGRRERIMRLLA